MTATEGPQVKALAIKQPWAEAIVRGWKDIENRSWETAYRGPVLIHASKAFDIGDAEDYLALVRDRKIERVNRDPVITIGTVRQRCGGIIGIAEIVDCVRASSSPWFVGRNGFVIRNARPIEIVPCRGQLGFFDPPAEVVLGAISRDPWWRA